MFTKYPNIFLKVQRLMERNHFVLIKDIDGIISQTIFETLSVLEDEKIINNQYKNK